MSESPLFGYLFIHTVKCFICAFFFLGELVFLFLLFPTSHEYAPPRYYEPWHQSGYPVQHPGHYRPQYFPQYRTQFSEYPAESQNSPRWIRISQPRQVDRNYDPNNENNGEAGRHFKPETIFKITETLGALNTVGRYLVNVTRTGEDTLSPEVPSALYTISKNVLGRNVTDTLAPFVREALPVLSDNEPEFTNDNQVSASTQNGNKLQEIDKVDQSDTDEDPRTCTTPDGLKG